MSSRVTQLNVEVIETAHADTALSLSRALYTVRRLIETRENLTLELPKRWRRGSKLVPIDYSLASTHCTTDSSIWLAPQYSAITGRGYMEYWRSILSKWCRRVIFISTSICLLIQTHLIDLTFSSSLLKGADGGCCNANNATCWRCIISLSDALFVCRKVFFVPFSHWHWTDLNPGTPGMQ